MTPEEAQKHTACLKAGMLARTRPNPFAPFVGPFMVTHTNFSGVVIPVVVDNDGSLVLRGPVLLDDRAEAYAISQAACAGLNAEWEKWKKENQ